MPVLKRSDCEIYYELAGTEGFPLLMFSNSLGTDLSMWEPQMAAFSTHFRILRYDNRGHGKSTASPGPYSIDLLASDAIALLDELAEKTVLFCGLSMGGMVGMWLGWNYPDRIRRLALCNTAASLGPAGDLGRAHSFGKTRRHASYIKSRAGTLVHHGLSRQVSGCGVGH